MMQDEDSKSWFHYTVTFVSVIVAAIVLSRPKKINKYSVRPKVTLKCQVFNFLLWPYKKFQLLKEFKPMEFSKLKRFAVKKTGLDDFGDKFHETPYDFFIKLANNTEYSPVGYAALQDFFKRLLITKLRIVKELKEDSMKEYMAANPIVKPIFIVGLPRTGTTYLQRLLSLDPASTSPITWELLDPVPRLKEDLDKDAKKRIKYTKKNVDMLISLIPQIQQVHEMGAEIPDECTILMGVDAPALFLNFHTLLEESTAEELLSWKWSEAYTNYYHALQIIRRYRSLREGLPETRRWILKAPQHLAVLDHLTKAFPDARIIWNHRDPKESLASFASLIRAGQDISEGSGMIQLDELGKAMLRYARIMYERGNKFFDSIGNTTSCRTSHVTYQKLIQDPIGTVKSLYEDFGYEFTDEYKSNIEAYLKEDTKKRNSMKGSKEKLHKYTLEEYGLTGADIDNEFGWYYDKYLKA